MSSTSTKEWTGATLGDGRYRVTGQLGEGGMGFVYRAQDMRLDTDVVIKVPHRELFGTDDVVQRFIREARSLVKLSHPHIVKITDVGEHENLPYIVMQYLGGGDLADRLASLRSQGQSPTPAQLLSWLTPIGRALDFIHERGYVHRDIKPANIIFDNYGNSYLSDFGIAKGLQAEVEAQTRRLTSTGMALGTPDYMAPELIMGQEIDGRADQYALAVVVFEALCGRPPFEGPTVGAVLVQHAKQSPPKPSDVNSALSGGLSETILRGLSKVPNERFPSLADFLAALTAASDANQANFSSTSVRTEQPASGSTETQGIQRPDVSTDAIRKVVCPSCAKSLSVKADLVGRLVQCPGCKERLRVSHDLSLIVASTMKQAVETNHTAASPPVTTSSEAKSRGAMRKVESQSVSPPATRRNLSRLYLFTGAAAILGALCVAVLIYYRLPAQISRHWNSTAVPQELSDRSQDQSENLKRIDDEGHSPSAPAATQIVVEPQNSIAQQAQDNPPTNNEQAAVQIAAAIGKMQAEMDRLAAEREKYPNVEESSDGKLQPKPGYKWVSEADGDFRVAWAPGKEHSKHPNVVASSNEGKWTPAPGYTWVDPQSDDFAVVRTHTSTDSDEEELGGRLRY